MVYQFGDCTLDTQRHRLQRTGRSMRLRSKAFQVLLYLLEHRDRTVLKQELCERIWPQQFISDATLESTLRTVRQAIGDSGRAQQLIQTVYGYGYRFIAAVEVCADLSPGAAGEVLRSLPGSASAPPPDDDLHMAPAPRAPESAGDDDCRCATGIRDEGKPTPQQVAVELAPERPAVPSPVWEEKPVAVLAVELTFPTATTDEAAACEPWSAASRWEQAITAKAQGFGGVVIQRSPSLLLVAFGVPRTLEQLPQRAVQAALALRQLVTDGAEGEPCPELRVAVHWGPLLVDVQAHDPAMPLRAFGETLAWPVRLLGQAAAGEILLSPEMGPLVEGWCELQAREVPLPGGQPGRISVCAVVGNRPQWPRLGMHGLRPLSPFVGRDRELALLRELLPQVEGSRGQVVGVIGEPGMGKSRLCYEFIRSALAPPWLILETQGTAYSQATPYRPIIDLLKGYFRLDDRDALPTMRDKVTATLRDLDDALTPAVPAFMALLDVPVEDPQWQALEAPQHRQRTLDAIKRLLVWESQAHPLLLVIENLHWIDTETQAVLDTLVESLPAARLLLLTTYRPEYQHGWGNKTCYTQLRLDPLPQKSARQLTGALLGDAAALAPLKQFLIERTEGNPFFLEESVRTLVETQVLVGNRGAYRVTKPLPSIQVPATVQAVLAARIDRLPPEEKQLLQTAAVIGTEVPLALLQAMAELPGEPLRLGLAHLQAGEFLYETRLFPEIEYTFKHALTREVAYGSLMHERRRVLHARIVEALEMLAGGRVAEQVERLAHHAPRGELWEKALMYGRRAGEKAEARAAPREAVTYFDQALQALAHLREHGDLRGMAIELRLALDSPLNALGEYGRRLALLREAEALARALDDRARLVRVLAGMTQLLRITGDRDGAIAVGRQALELAAELGESALQVEAAHRLGQVYYALGDFGRAAKLLQRNVETADRESDTLSIDWRIQSRAWLTYTLSTLGAFAEGRGRGEEALRLATMEVRESILIMAHAALAHLYLAQGDLAHAIRVFEQGLALCRASGERDLLRGILAGLGHAYVLQGRLAEGRAAGGGDR
jgi:DNA-binding winged helix-turn-helix (wHTH) protein/tetratricopeptide (TPR) repeat protein